MARDAVDGGPTPTRLATFVYDLTPTAPAAGTEQAAALPDLWGTTTYDRWRQAVPPVKAFAVFGPDRVPGGSDTATRAATVTAADWQYADLRYTDALGYTVNTAPGLADRHVRDVLAGRASQVAGGHGAASGRQVADGPPDRGHPHHDRV